MAICRVFLLLAAVLVVAAPLPFVFALSSTVPAFLWAHDLDGAKEIVDYRVLSPRALAKFVMTEGGWSKYLCSEEESQQPQNFAFLFIGNELNTRDITGPSKADPALVNLLKDAFTNSNASIAFPYLTAVEEKEPIETSLISEFADNCQQNLKINQIALAGSCLVHGENFHRLTDTGSINDYLNSRNGQDGRNNLIVLCHGDSAHDSISNVSDSESSILSQLLSSVSHLGVKYTVLYVSDPFRSTQFIPHRGLERFLAEGTIGNVSANSTGCDSVCQIKASLLEGFLVGVVLLIILISGLCCMMGIDTPTRFETPQDS